LNEYPDQIDGFERLGQVYEARGKKQTAADFAKTMPGFDQQSIDYYLSKAKSMTEEKKQKNQIQRK